MTDEKLDNMIRMVIESNAPFSDLVDLVGLDPYSDFIGQDLSGIDFGTSDLHEFRFANSILDNADLSRCTLSRDTLQGVLSAKDALIPRIAEVIDRGRSITVRLSFGEQSILSQTFGSIRRSILETIAAASATSWPDLEQALDALLKEGTGGYESDDRRVGVKLPNEAHRALTNISMRMGGPRTAILRLLLKLTVASIENVPNADQDPVFGKFLREFSKTIRSVRSDSPRQGFLF